MKRTPIDNTAIHIQTNIQTPLLSDRDQAIKDVSFKPSLASSIWHILSLSKLNFLLIFFPIGTIVDQLNLSSTLIFTTNFLAILPLAQLLSYSTEETSLYFGENVGGLLNATFGNAVELIVSVIALRKDLIRVVQTSLLGSILSNLLLVTGFSFFLGGLKYHNQKFNTTAAQTFASLLAITLLALMIPAALYSTTDQNTIQESSILSFSRATAIVLLLVYACYLAFQLKTHSHLYDGEDCSDCWKIAKSCTAHNALRDDASSDLDLFKDQEEQPHLSKSFSLSLMILVTLAVSWSADIMVDSIHGFTQSLNLSEAFVGFVLLPIVANASEHISAVTFALKNKMDLSLGVTFGSCMQIALLLVPVLVLYGWAIDKPLTLFFQTFETTVLFVSVLVGNYLIMDGQSNWLEGTLLLGTYSIVSLAFFFYPDA